jgi:hypothetical protein
VEYITKDRAWAGLTVIFIDSALWQQPVLVWTDGGVLSLGMIGHSEGARPIHVVYSGGNLYDALHYSVDDAPGLLYPGIA